MSTVCESGSLLCAATGPSFKNDDGDTSNDCIEMANGILIAKPIGNDTEVRAETNSEGHGRAVPHLMFKEMKTFDDN